MQEITEKLEDSSVGESYRGKNSHKGLLVIGSSSVSPSLSDDGSATDKRVAAARPEETGENLKPKTKTRRKSLAPDGSTWSEWDAHDQVWKTAKLIELGVTKAGPSALPNKEETKTPKAKASGYAGLREFLEDGRREPLDFDSIYGGLKDWDSEEL